MNFKQLIGICEVALVKKTTVVLSIKKDSKIPAGFPKGRVLFVAQKDMDANGVHVPAGASLVEFEADGVIDWLYAHAQERKRLFMNPRGVFGCPKA